MHEDIMLNVNGLDTTHKAVRELDWYAYIWYELYRSNMKMFMQVLKLYIAFLEKFSGRRKLFSS